MPGRGSEFFTIPDSFWQRPEVTEILRTRDVGRLLVLVAQSARASQTQLATACGMTQPKINAIMRSAQKVQSLEVFERIADALEMPGPARLILGLAPRPAEPKSGQPPLIATAGNTAAGVTALASTGEDAVAAAAGEASADWLRLACEFDPESLDWLQAESLDIAQATNRLPLATFSAARRVRRDALQLAGRTRRPALLSDLYAISGQATALMASSAFDLNRWSESEDLARSAISYADLAGHSSLQAWTHGLAALLANWRREPDIALSHFRRGMQIAPHGAPRFRLRYIAARSYALLGDATSVAEVLADARNDEDHAQQHPDPLSTETGGEFAFGRARAEACAAAAWLDLGRGLEALRTAQSALAALTSEPTARRPQSQVNGVQIDMATAYLLSGELDGSAEALRPVLAQPPALRNVSLTGRLARTRTVLLSSAWTANAPAQQTADEIGEWLT